MADQKRQKAQSDRRIISHPGGGLTVRRAPRNSSVRTDSTQRRVLNGGALPRELFATLIPEHCRPPLSLVGGMKKRKRKRKKEGRGRAHAGSERRGLNLHALPARAAAPTVNFSGTHHRICAGARARARRYDSIFFNRRESLRIVYCVARDAVRELASRTARGAFPHF